MIYQATFVIAATLVACTKAYPTGAQNNASNPMDAFSAYCTTGNFRPNHGNHLPQFSPAPYVITVSSPAGAIYKPGQKVTITIASKKQPALHKFKGFFLQGDSTEAAFSGDITCGNQGHKVNFCGKTGATHTNALVKEQVVCEWTPPDFQIGQVQFVATIVENFSTFWTGVKSSTNLGPDPATMSFEQKTQQLRAQMMRQFQQGGLGNIMGQQSGANPFAALGRGAAAGQQNPFAGIFQQSQQLAG